jgi:hypothetical protein
LVLKNRSTTNAAYKLINDILQALNNKKKRGGILFDFEKAFDCVNHNILMNKISYYGVNGVFFSLIKSYLENRYKRLNLITNYRNGKKLEKESHKGQCWDHCYF